MEVLLKQFEVRYNQDEYNMLQDIFDGENGFMNPAYGLDKEQYMKWLRNVDDSSKEINLEEGWIPETTYFLYVDNVPVGYGRIRHSSNEYLE